LKKKNPNNSKDSNQAPQIVLVNVCVWRNVVVTIAQFFFNKGEHYQLYDVKVLSVKVPTFRTTTRSS
jgi:hypothetical protein